MPEMILPGVYIEVRAEGLIAPGQVTVGNLGVVGTANKGEIGVPVLLGSFSDATERFGSADAFIDGRSNELTLVRALRLAYDAGASTVYAVRVTSTEPAVAGENFIPPFGLNTKARKASLNVAGDTAGTVAVILNARDHGTWGNKIGVNVFDAEEDAFIINESQPGTAPVTLSHRPVVPDNPRNKVTVRYVATGQTRTFTTVNAAPAADQVQINPTTGVLTFFAGQVPGNNDAVTASYVVPRSNSRKVTISAAGVTEIYTVANGQHLIDLLNNPDSPSLLVKATGTGAAPGEVPKKHANIDDVRTLSGGSDGADALDSDYKLGLDQLLNDLAHIIVAAGMDNERIGDELKAHCDAASTDKKQKDRIAVVGSRVGADLNRILGHTLNSDRVVFVAPGIKTNDQASGKEVTLPGSYTAAVVAGMLSARSPHVSLTNKSVPVGALEARFNQAQLEQLVQARVLAIEERRGLGIRVVKAITTDPGAFRQITTRRITDYAKYGVRSAAEPYIGLLNNERVRGALRATINSFLVGMVDDEMLVSYDLQVTATRDQQRQGIVQVTMVLRPVFSIDFIRVTMFLE
jgi:hypothetical protein